MGNDVATTDEAALLRPLHAMNAGDGPLSYAQNSSYQRGIVDVAKPIIEQEIATKLDLKKTSPNGSICIADFGCSTGHNSFPAIDFITDAINQNHQAHNHTKPPPEFFVFFNDVMSNDFNTLIDSLPPNRNYSAITAPGDFHGRLVPKSSLHVGYSCWALHWLTKVPGAGNPTWNKGQIYYSEDRKEVRDAYLEQYSKDIGAFLEARAAEMVDGGLLTLLIAGAPAHYVTKDIVLMGTSLMDLAKKGKIKESLVDSFNHPVYFPTEEEMNSILERNHSFTVERFEILENPGKYNVKTSAQQATFLRSAHESLLKNHFGSDIDLDDLFDILKKKLDASPELLEPENDEGFQILLVLKRNSSDY